MKKRAYYSEIMAALTGQSDSLRGVPADRVDWAGASVVMELYDGTSASERGEFVRALAQIIEEAPETPIFAQLIQIDSSLDIVEVESSVAKVRDGKAKVQRDPSVNEAVNNYQTFRSFKAHKA